MAARQPWARALAIVPALAIGAAVFIAGYVVAKLCFFPAGPVRGTLYVAIAATLAASLAFLTDQDGDPGRMLVVGAGARVLVGLSLLPAWLGPRSRAGAALELR